MESLLCAMTDEEQDTVDFTGPFCGHPDARKALDNVIAHREGVSKGQLPAVFWDGPWAPK
jgi:hypothetical protein